MADTATSQNTDLSSWDTLYNPPKSDVAEINVASIFRVELCKVMNYNDVRIYSFA
jgi:hypothetical protein